MYVKILSSPRTIEKKIGSKQKKIGSELKCKVLGGISSRMAPNNFDHPPLPLTCNLVDGGGWANKKHCLGVILK